jgi:hypothetical protein
MKKYLVVINLVIGIVLFGFLWAINNEIEEVNLIYSYTQKDIESLVNKYQDSTSTIRRHYSSSELGEYAKKLNDDSLINFIMSQRDQVGYFTSYQGELNVKLNLLNEELTLRKRTFYILGVMTLINFIITLTVLLKYRDRKKGDKL